MKALAPPRTTPLLLILSVFLWLLTAAVPAAAEERTSSDPPFIKGLVQSVSSSERLLVIQPLKGAKVMIRVTPETRFQWVGKLEDLQPRQEVKVWYRPDPEGNIGLKIQKLPDLGC